jgi:ATP-dependent helicase/nuclease subunit A
MRGRFSRQPQTSAANPVQLMTIHRAKGLEFDHVFVPSLDRELNRGREPLLRWLDLPRSEGESDLIMAPVPAIGDDEGGEVSTYLKRLISRRAANEQTRLLYVAATRAKQTLELSGAPKVRTDGSIAPRNGTLLACLWPAVAPSFSANADWVYAMNQPGATAPGTVVPAGSPPAATRPNATAPDAQPTDPRAEPAGPHEQPGDSRPESAGPQAQPEESPSQQVRRLVSNWSLPTLTTVPELPHLPIAHQSLDPPEFSWVGETARHIGTVVHAALEGYATATRLPTRDAIEAERDFYVYQLRRHGVPESDLARAASTVVEALTRTVSNDRGRWIFAGEHRDARSEWALTGIAAGRLTSVVVDRSFVDKDGTRWVIDFKTSSHEGGGLEAFLDQEMARYRAQLETYVALARGIGAQPVRAGLYFPLLDVFRELS